MSSEVGLLFQVKHSDDIQQYVRHATTRGTVLWGADFTMDTKAVRYPLVVYLYNPVRAGSAEPGVQAYGVASRVSSGQAAVAATSPDMVPAHLRAEAHPTWFRFDQILPISPSVSFREFYSLNGQRLESVDANRPTILGPPYPVRHPPA